MNKNKNIFKRIVIENIKLVRFRYSDLYVRNILQIDCNKPLLYFYFSFN
jgi:hypothetical protein